jgi:threonine/homoserine/homoserine lactone efflux protein
VVAVGYVAALMFFSQSVPRMIKVLGAASLLYLAVTAGFARWELRQRTTADASPL